MTDSSILNCYVVTSSNSGVTEQVIVLLLYACTNLLYCIRFRYAFVCSAVFFQFVATQVAAAAAVGALVAAAVAVAALMAAGATGGAAAAGTAVLTLAPVTTASLRSADRPALRPGVCRRSPGLGSVGSPLRPALISTSQKVRIIVPHTCMYSNIQHTDTYTQIHTYLNVND